MKEEGEADSFVGQSPPTNSGGPVGLFSQSASGPDPFAQVGQNPHPTNFQPSHPTTRSTPPPQPPVSGQGPYSQLPVFGAQPGHGSSVRQPSMNTDHASHNIYRQQGRPRYAPPPPGTYAPAMGQHMNNSPFSLPIPPPARPPSVGVGQNMGMTSIHPPLGSPDNASAVYETVQPHWCYCKLVEGKEHWYPFSLMDAMKLEDAISGKSGGVLQDPDNIVIATDGGRYDVYVKQRQRRAVYW
ncbi:hypothetical protein ScPMuIL_007129 [Solemya velum]